MPSSKEKNWDLIVKELPEKLYKINISASTQEKIEKLHQYLNNNPKTNCLYYFNHISYSDPLLVGHIIDKIDPNKTRPIIIPVSYSHTEPKKIKNIPSIAMIKLAGACGVNPFRVIQNYQINNPHFNYDEAMAQKININLFQELKKYKKSELPFALAISPEGHRSDNGILGEAESGMLSIARYIEPVLLVPIAIHYDKKYNRNGTNIGKNVSLEIGKEYLYNNQEKRDIDFYMNRLALALPPQMRGKYNSEIKSS